MRTRFARLCLAALLSMVLVWGTTPLAAADEWTVTLLISNGGDAEQELIFGIHPEGTDGVDSELGEVGLPPWPPSSIFDARFMIDGIEGLRVDIRDDSPTERLHEIQWQAGDGGYPITLRWNRETLPPAILTMMDGFTGDFIEPFDMSETDSLVIPPELSFIDRLDLVVLPDSVLPRPPVIDPPIPDLLVYVGQQFPELALDDHVQDPDTPVEDLMWLVSGDNPPWILISEDRVLSVEVPAGWAGSRIFNLRVIDPGGLEDDQDFLISAVTGGQPTWTVGLTLENGIGDLGHTYFGLHPDATDGIDPELGEVALPPWPPSDIFDARMLLPDELTHSQRDIRLSEPGFVEYHVQWQAGDGGYPITVSWAEDLPLGDFFISDDIDGSFLQPLDMTAAQVLEVPDSLSFITGLIISVDPVVDTTPPLGPFDLRVTDYTPGAFASLEWSECEEEHFAYYEVLYDSLYFTTESNDVWDWTEDPDLGLRETATTTVLLPGDASAWNFRIRAWDIFGNQGALSHLVSVGEPVGVEAEQPGSGATLLQNHPNPFNPQTTISFSMRERASVSIGIYDLSGRRVRVLAPEDPFTPGIHRLTWDGKDDEGRHLPSGIYICRAKGWTLLGHTKDDPSAVMAGRLRQGYNSGSSPRARLPRAMIRGPDPMARVPLDL